MLNCVSNGNILKSKLFDNVYAAPACGDEGLATGSALGLNHFLLERPKIQHTIKETFEGGISYTAAQIEQSILPFSDLVSFSKMDEIGLLNKATDAIAEGKIIAWFEGGSEVGPRALGHRSIIVDPRRKDMKDILNARVKHREPFRPFAPAVLIEHARDWFDLEGESPFMLFSVQCLKPDQLPATTHVDGSARVQTVDADNNGRYYQLIKTFYNKFEVPVLLNTSFNDNGEPIVETPTDALRCFLKTEIDVLILEDFYVEKKCRD
jgi:carbamoyltransferase